MSKRWTIEDLVRAVPIPIHDLNQAISRNGFRPEHTPEPGKERWYSWRDVVAIAAAQELKAIGHKPKVAFGLVKHHLSPFLHDHVDKPDDCDRVLWIIEPSQPGCRHKFDCSFVFEVDVSFLDGIGSQNPCICVNVGSIARRVLKNLRMQQVAAMAADDLQGLQTALADALAQE
ncbi:MAG: hypothetical protein Q8O82_08585 [Pseudorhodobacter sp.]|nr:hypothetical protein [Pseudorhodobacter sp.]